MTRVAENINVLVDQIPAKIKIVAVSKFKPAKMLLEAYNIGLKRFGENYVQELVDKYQELPKDIEWHFIGHLQTNKVKYIAPFVHMIHSVDSFKLLVEINKQAKKNERNIDCLIQINIAEEDSKTGFEETVFIEMLNNSSINDLTNIKICGLMGMSTFTENLEQIRKEFKLLKTISDKAQSFNHKNIELKEISRGMSGDWKIAIEEGSTMSRIGSAIFGNRN